MNHGHSHKVRLQVERLEERMLLSAEYHDGYVWIRGTAANDVASVKYLPPMGIRVDLNGVNYDFPDAAGAGVKFWGYGGNDVLRSYVDAETIGYGGAGNDKLYIRHRALGYWGHQLYGGPGNDLLVGGNSRNKLYGNAGNDTLIGANSMNDYLVGGDGNDRLYGKSSEGPRMGAIGDQLFGGRGNDLLNGGQEGYIDKMVGGSGADRFVADWVSINGRWRNTDRPVDFRAGEGDRVLG